MQNRTCFLSLFDLVSFFKKAHATWQLRDFQFIASLGHLGWPGYPSDPVSGGGNVLFLQTATSPGKPQPGSHTARSVFLIPSLIVSSVRRFLEDRLQLWYFSILGEFFFLLQGHRKDHLARLADMYCMFKCWPFPPCLCILDKFFRLSLNLLPINGAKSGDHRLMPLRARRA